VNSAEDLESHQSRSALASETPAVSLRRLPHYQPMVLCVIAFLSGILLDYSLSLSVWIYASSVLFSVIVWDVFYRRSDAHGLTSYAHGMMSAALLAGILALGAAWHHGQWNWYGHDEIGLFAGDVGGPVCLEAVATSEPRWMAPSSSVDVGLDYREATEGRTRVSLRVQRIRDGEDWKTVSGKLDLVIHGPADHFRAGDRLQVFGRLVRIAQPTNPGQFDFQSFYRSQRKLAALHVYHSQCVAVIEPAKWWKTKFISSLRRQLNSFAWEFIGNDEASFASAILLGNREQMSPQRRDVFLKTGTVHLLAISGLHVGILAGSVFLLFRIGLFNRRQCLWATILFVIFYAWLVEFRPPVSRAAILIVLFCVGRLLGERNFSFNLLSIAGLIVLLLNPMDLFGLGTQLSFLAVTALMFGKSWVFWPPPTDPIKRLIASTRSTPVRTINWLGRQLRTGFLVSGLIWWVAMPLVAFRFHLIAPVALLVNPLLLLPIALALYGGLGVMIFGWFASPLANICGLFCQWNLSLIEWMIGVAQSLPLGYCWTAGPTLFALIVFYVGLFFVAVFPPTRLRLKAICWLVVGWILFGWVIPDRVNQSWRGTQDNPLVCVFIDVGHGTSVLLRLPDGKNVLYDAGSFGSSAYGYRNVSAVLWHERIEYLDAVVISHADIDHFNAVPELSRRFGIGEVIVSPQMLQKNATAVRTLLNQLAAVRVPLRTVFVGETGSSGLAGFAGLSILNPPENGTGGNDNSDSIVLLVEHAGRKILLPGDLESKGLEALLTRPKLDCDLVMAPHHGSFNSDPSEFMSWSTPEVVVISGGSHKIKEHVVKIFERDERCVVRTDHDGAIRYVVAEESVSLQRWKFDHWSEVAQEKIETP